MTRYHDFNNYKLSEDEQRRMKDGTAVILGAAGLCVVFLIIYSLSDWGWVVERFSE